MLGGEELESFEGGVKSVQEWEGGDVSSDREDA